MVMIDSFKDIYSNIHYNTLLPRTTTTLEEDMTEEMPANS